MTEMHGDVLLEPTLGMSPNAGDVAQCSKLVVRVLVGGHLAASAESARTGTEVSSQICALIRAGLVRFLAKGHAGSWPRSRLHSLYARVTQMHQPR